MHGPMTEQSAASEAPLAVTPPQQTGLCSQPVHGDLVQRDGTVSDVVWQVPDEVPIALMLNSQPYAVMMATPANLTDFGRGFVVGEGIVPSAADVKGVLVLPADTGSDLSRGFAVDVAVDEAVLAGSHLAPRSMEGRSGCGLCGISEISDVVRQPRAVEISVRPPAHAVIQAAATLPGRQPMGRFNRSVHAAAWVQLDGEIVIVREDVGRHNALDKLIGALMVTKTDLSTGFVLMTSRCSFELVQKAATAGIGALVTVSAPTALALRLAQSSKLWIGAIGHGGVVQFSEMAAS